MLEHPWLNMEDNYEYKYTDKEYEIMMLKKDLKEKTRGKVDEDNQNQDMGELIDTDD
jgi:hypothetical protein